jgi:hypothetical protein
MLSPEQIASYQQHGYLLLKGAVSDADIERLERGLARNPPLDGTLAGTQNYPEPGRYTLATNSLKDPDLAFIVEHPTIVGAAAELLDDDPVLTAYVIYDRTPGGGGLPAHNDYKRWRPVGSSMNWLFTIVPFTDFDEDAGPLYVAPGSHQPERVFDGGDVALCVRPPTAPKDEDFIDPGLERGDLLLMNMYLWHKASGNDSKGHRVGLFNKYAGASFPPATGYYLFDDDVYAALSEKGRRLIAVHSNRKIETTRAVLIRSNGDQREVLVVDDLGDGPTRYRLPGGRCFDERAIPDWDLGNYIAPLKAHLVKDIGIEPPWVSYVGDYNEEAHLCRVYGYTLTGRGFPVPYQGARWVPVDELDTAGAQFGYEQTAVEAWLDPTPIRGKGLTQAQSRVDQYAY